MDFVLLYWISLYLFLPLPASWCAFLGGSFRSILLMLAFRSVTCKLGPLWWFTLTLGLWPELNFCSDIFSSKNIHRGKTFWQKLQQLWINNQPNLLQSHCLSLKVWNVRLCVRFMVINMEANFCHFKMLLLPVGLCMTSVFIKSWLQPLCELIGVPLFIAS